MNLDLTIVLCPLVLVVIDAQGCTFIFFLHGIQRIKSPVLMLAPDTESSHQPLLTKFNHTTVHRE